MNDLTQAALLLLAAVVAFLLISRGMRKREERWASDDWRRDDRPSTGLGNALLEIQSLLEPGSKSQVEEVMRQRREDAGPADPPTPGDDDHGAPTTGAGSGDPDRA